MMMELSYLADSYPVEIWRGRAIQVIANLAADMMIVRFPDETSERTFFVDKKHIVSEPPAPPKSPRIFILEQLQEYESALFDLWEGTGNNETLTEQIEKMISLYVGETNE